jgi:hypothetical protein
MTDPIRELQCSLFALSARLEAVEARLPWIGTAADVAPQVVSITTPVDPAPQAQQGVTVEELVDCLPDAFKGDLDSFARYLLSHPRLGPLLRGEGAPAPVRVVLPEEPRYPNSLVSGNAYYLYGYLDAWAAARAEVERQQGGRADG